MDAYTTAADAIARSISHDERAAMALDETISGKEARIEAALSELEEHGHDVEDHVEIEGGVDVWGTTDDGSEWRVLLVDGLTTSVRYIVGAGHQGNHRTTSVQS